MKCSNALELISRQLDGDLSPSEEQILSFHIMGCPTCRKATQMTRDISFVMRSIDKPVPPTVLAEKVYERLASGQYSLKVSWKKHFWRNVVIIPVAATLLILLTIPHKNKELTSVIGNSSEISSETELEDISEVKTTKYHTFPLVAYSQEGRLVTF